jgi:hypothetical protein
MSYCFKFNCIAFGLTLTGLVGACDHDDITSRIAETSVPCGGLAGSECPDGLLCADDPADDCDPGQGADCAGICVEPGPAICGGFAGLMCPMGQTCVDDPRDSCDPMLGGADCSGICEDVDGGANGHHPHPHKPGKPGKPGKGKPGKPTKCEDDGRSYVSHDPNQCAAILFQCGDGETAFFDECGCGCVPA